MSGFVSVYIQHFTYAGLFGVLLLCGLGLPIPEDVVLLSAGFLIHRGVIRYPTTLVIGLIGVVAGDNSLFFIGRKFGTGVVRYFQLGRPQSRYQIERLKNFMERHGPKAIFYARFLAGLRALVYLTAGSLDVQPSRFIFYDALGAMISVPIVVSLGYIFGEEIEQVFRYLGGFEHLIWIVGLGALVIYGSRMLVLSNRRNADADPT